MVAPARLYRIYMTLAAHIDEVVDFEQAQGRALSGTLKLLSAGNAAKPLARWAEEMAELCGVLDGSHDDSFLMEATQTFYWASLFGGLRRASWDSLEFAKQQQAASTTGLNTVPELRAAVSRIAAMPADSVPVGKLYLCWLAAYAIYSKQTPAEDRWSIEQILEADFQELKKREYIQPILTMVPA